MRAHALATLLFFTAMCAACVEESASANVAPPSAATTGPSIVGLVVDAELFPLAGVGIVVDDGAFITETDENGAFAAGPLEPGSHDVVAEKEGYAPVSQAVAVDDGPAKVLLTLTGTSRSVPYRETIHVVSSVWCGVYTVYACNQVDRNTQANLTDDRSIFVLTIPGPGLSNLLHEMVWNPQAGLGGRTLRVEVRPHPAPAVFTEDVPAYAIQFGASPIRTWLLPGEKGLGANTEFIGDDGYEYDVYIRHDYQNNTVVSPHIDQRVDNWVTFFFHRPGPAEFSAYEDV